MHRRRASWNIRRPGKPLAFCYEALATLTGLAVVSLVALGAIARPLMFASLQPELAEAKGLFVW
jgi:zinc/manganese transport system permease protein